MTSAIGSAGVSGGIPAASAASASSVGSAVDPAAAAAAAGNGASTGAATGTDTSSLGAAASDPAAASAAGASQAAAGAAGVGATGAGGPLSAMGKMPSFMGPLMILGGAGLAMWGLHRAGVAKTAAALESAQVGHTVLPAVSKLPMMIGGSMGLSGLFLTYTSSKSGVAKAQAERKMVEDQATQIITQQQQQAQQLQQIALQYKQQAEAGSASAAGGAGLAGITAGAAAGAAGATGATGAGTSAAGTAANPGTASPIAGAAGAATTGAATAGASTTGAAGTAAGAGAAGATTSQGAAPLASGQWSASALLGSAVQLGAAVQGGATLADGGSFSLSAVTGDANGYASFAEADAALKSTVSPDAGGMNGVKSVRWIVLQHEGRFYGYTAVQDATGGAAPVNAANGTVVGWRALRFMQNGASGAWTSYHWSQGGGQAFEPFGGNVSGGGPGSVGGSTTGAAATSSTGTTQAAAGGSTGDVTGGGPATTANAVAGQLGRGFAVNASGTARGGWLQLQQQAGGSYATPGEAGAAARGVRAGFGSDAWKRTVTLRGSDGRYYVFAGSLVSQQTPALTADAAPVHVFGAGFAEYYDGSSWRATAEA